MYSISSFALCALPDHVHLYLWNTHCWMSLVVYFNFWTCKIYCGFLCWDMWWLSQFKFAANMCKPQESPDHTRTKYNKQNGKWFIRHACQMLKADQDWSAIVAAQQHAMHSHVSCINFIYTYFNTWAPLFRGVHSAAILTLQMLTLIKTHSTSHRLIWMELQHRQQSCPGYCYPHRYCQHCCCHSRSQHCCSQHSMCLHAQTDCINKNLDQFTWMC